MGKDDLVAEALKALKVSVPVYRAEVSGNKVTLYLYGHREPVTWTKPPKRSKKKETDK